ncbi:hypothetical protein HY992_06005 [Candidatus Micrarchaeota archaeon]|nr:hypothetical protein [Candidatus Micrarchaeota archaeon]
MAQAQASVQRTPGPSFKGAEAEVQFNTLIQRIARGYGVQRVALDLIEAFKFAFVSRKLEMLSLSFWKTGPKQSDAEVTVSLRGNSKGAATSIELFINAQGISCVLEDGQTPVEHKWRMLFTVPGVVGLFFDITDRPAFERFMLEAHQLAQQLAAS